jgi:S-DNA-T family DNA segregation ATPase FtsK/SpoIIIE
MTGGFSPVSVRSQFPDPQVGAAILTRAIALRGGVAATGDDLPEARDLLADLVTVSARNGQHWAPAAEALTDRWPHAYPGMTAEALSELARNLGAASVDVKIGGTNLKGYRIEALRDLIASRNGAAH